MSVTAYIGLGSNLGDRHDYLQRALQALREQPGVVVVGLSSIHETEPEGGPTGQGKYLNAVAELQTDLNPGELLRILLDVEQRLGRIRGERNGPRTIDLDLLLYGDLILKEPGLTLPHPRMHERSFVLEPLSEIAASAIHPVLRCTVRQLAEERSDSPLPAGQPAEAPGRELTGLRALVTGSTSGIGRAIALELAAAGAHVIIHGRRSLVAAEAVAGQARSQGVRAQVLPADLRDPEACRRLARDGWQQWNGLDIWINNAGADTLTGEGTAWPFERKLEELVAIDVRATMVLARDVGQRMKEAGGGVILNMGWDQAETGMEGDSGQLFGAAKAAVMAFTKSLARTLAPSVRVNGLAPGWIRTAWGEQASSVWQERVRRDTLLQRWGTPEDVAAAARWLVGPGARFLTGQNIRVNGGAVT
jgi:2-amino-4-hydroxy-6-hydroxymethyldihydropteridine diphosphokinase